MNLPRGRDLHHVLLEWVVEPVIFAIFALFILTMLLWAALVIYVALSTTFSI